MSYKVKQLGKKRHGSENEYWHGGGNDTHNI